METPPIKPRRPWLAGVLSLLLGGPVGQIYVGRLRRSLCLWGLGTCLLVLAFGTIGLPIGRSGLLLIALCVVAPPACFATDAFLLARRNRYVVPKRYQRWWVYVFFVGLFALANIAVGHFVRAFVAEGLIMPTRSMSPTVQPGERFLADKLWLNRTRIRRGDVVVYRCGGPDSPPYFHRVAGLPGDTIEITNQRVFVNGVEWRDPHAVFAGPLPPYGAPANYGPVKVPPGYCFLLGDNRRMSKDSRMTGPIPLSNLCGIARLIYWSRKVTFPDPNDPTLSVSGPIRWERFGLRLD